MRTFKRRQYGMTLLELLVASGLLALFTLTLTQLLMGGMRTYKRGQAISSLRNDLKLALDTVADDVRSAKKISNNMFKNTKILNFSLETYRQDLTNAGKTESIVTTITYALVPDEGALIRSEDDKATLLARDLVIDSVPGNSESYFMFCHDETEESNPNIEIEMRLSAMRFVGSDEQRMSMVTHATATGTFADTYNRQPVDMVPLVKIGSLERPVLRSFVRNRKPIGAERTTAER